MTDQTQIEVKDFQLGLTMSGAISAGAYTAGVFDFLIQALDEWEKARNGEGKASVPAHRVGIKVMSGASAGAITAAIGAIALADACQQPCMVTKFAEGEQKIQYYMPGLYEAWVVKPTLVAKEAGALDFLSTSDLSETPKDDFSYTTGCVSSPATISTPPLPVVSLLNARLLDEIAQDAIAVTPPFSPPRAYIAKTLHIYMTLSNLRGVPYKVTFEGGDYQMISHGDRVHYAVGGLGAWDSPSAFGERDQKRDIEVESLDRAHSGNLRWRDFSIFALASAAFPVGLAPRNLSATLGTKIGPDGYSQEYNDRLFPIDSLARRKNLISPCFPKDSVESPSFTFRTADGGIIDNDPFEYARFCLKTADELATGTEDSSNGLPANADHAVVMISPFPASQPIAPEGQPAPDILSIFSALMPSLIDQVRFKPNELVLAADENYGSRYLIGPTRTLPDKTQARYPIASGLLSGFGGFVAQCFRDHDFQLGRRNCQWFLQTNFALPADNEIIRFGFKGLDKERFRAKDTDTHQPQEDIVILPLFGTALDEVPLPEWPQIPDKEFEILQSRIATRFDAVAPALLAANVKDNLLWLLLRIALVANPWLPPPFGIVREKALKYVRLTILADLVRRNQIEGWDFGEPPQGLHPDDIRLVLGEFLNPAYDLRNVAGLAKSTNLAPPAVVKIISFLQSAAAKGGKPFEIWTSSRKDKAKGELYTLVSRKPGPLSEALGTVLGNTKLAFFVNQPKTDLPGL